MAVDAERLAKIKEDIDFDLYQFAETLGYDPKVYPFDEFHKLLDDMEKEPVYEEDCE